MGTSINIQMRGFVGSDPQVKTVGELQRGSQPEEGRRYETYTLAVSELMLLANRELGSDQVS